jgi:hypothetical protein
MNEPNIEIDCYLIHEKTAYGEIYTTNINSSDQQAVCLLKLIRDKEFFI